MKIENLIYTLLDIIIRKGARATVKIKIAKITKDEERKYKRDEKGQFARTGSASTGRSGKNATTSSRLSSSKPTGLPKGHTKATLDAKAIGFIQSRPGVFSYDNKTGAFLQYERSAEGPDDKRLLHFYDKILQPDEKQAICAFIKNKNFLNKMRAAQRGEIDEPAFIEAGQAAERGLRKLPHWSDDESMLYRGITITPEQFEAIKNPGNDIPLGGFSSWSTNERVAKGFAGLRHEQQNANANADELVEVVLQFKGTFKVAADIQPFSGKFFHQEEIGVSGDTKIRCTKAGKPKINPKTGRKCVYIDVEEYE